MDTGQMRQVRRFNRVVTQRTGALEASYLRRGRLVAAMAEVGRLMRAVSVEVRLEAPGSAASRWCLEEYFRELSERFEFGFDPSRSNSVRAEEMSPPAGFFVIAWLDDRAVGCGGLKFGYKTIGEIKRMWAHPPRADWASHARY